MLKSLITLLLASSVSAAYGRVIITSSDGVQDSQMDIDSLFPSTTNAETGSVSDNSCWHDGAPIRAPTFRHPVADTCLQIEAGRQVKIYSTAVCSNGTEAMFARWAGPSCVGEPASVDVVDEDMLKTCLKMPSSGPGSYAFWCEGEVEPLPVKKPNGNGGSSFAPILIILGIFLFIILFALVRLALFIHRSVTQGNKILVSKQWRCISRLITDITIRIFSKGERVKSLYDRSNRRYNVDIFRTKLKNLSLWYV